MEYRRPASLPHLSSLAVEIISPNHPGEEGQRIYTRETQHFPTWVSLLEEDLYDERHTFFNELLANSNALALVPVGALYWDELTKAQESVYLEQSTPEEALERVKTIVQAQLQPYCAQLQTER